MKSGDEVIVTYRKLRGGDLKTEDGIIIKIGKEYFDVKFPGEVITTSLEWERVIKVDVTSEL